MQLLSLCQQGLDDDDDGGGGGGGMAEEEEETVEVTTGGVNIVPTQKDPLKGKIREPIPRANLQKAMLW